MANVRKGMTVGNKSDAFGNVALYISSCQLDSLALLMSVKMKTIIYFKIV